MSGELGFLNSFRERIYGPLQEYRGNDGTPGKEIDFIDYVQKQCPNGQGGFGLNNAAGQPLTWQDIFCDLGKDPDFLSLDNLLSLTGELRYLAPEIVREYVLKGFTSDSSDMDLVAGSENVDSLTVTAPWIQYNDADMEDIGEAETFPEASIEWSEKTVKIKKKAIAIKMTDEILLSVKLPLLQYFLRRVGVQLAAKQFRTAVTTLINGDQADSSDACTIVGTATGSTITYDDFLPVWIRGRRIGMRWENMITDEVMANVLLKLSEFKTQQGLGGIVTNISTRNKVVPSELPHVISGDMSSNHVMLIDKAQAMVKLTFRGLLVESERIIMRQINGTAASIMNGYMTVDRNARIIISKALAFSGNGFPSYMVPLT